MGVQMWFMGCISVGTGVEGSDLGSGESGRAW